MLVVHGHREGNAAGGGTAISLEAVARVRRAEQAARKHHVERILFCGGGAPGHASEASQMAACWRGPPIQVYLDEVSTDSAENATEALRWARELHVNELLVVSSWWHIRLPLYYRGARAVSVRFMRCWRWDRAARRIAHELRYLPRACR